MRFIIGEVFMHHIRKQQFENLEIKAPVSLCDTDGNLNPEARGWSRVPFQTCNLTHHFLRKKKWNYWCITGKDHLFSITISDLDYAGVIFAYFLDFKTHVIVEKSITVPFGKNVYLGESVFTPASFTNADVDVQFEHDDRGVAISLSWLNFSQGKDLSAEISILLPKKHQSLNVVVPWNDTDRFQCTSKQNGLPASGFYSFGDQRFEFQQNESFACLDFSRGIWPYRSSWNWGTFSGYAGKDIVGLNMGARWTDGTGITENFLCMNGKLSKIKEDIIFEYDRHDFMKPWKIYTGKSNNVDLIMTPFLERYVKSDLLVVKSVTHQLFGRYSGTVISGNKKIRIDSITGWAEEHAARW